MRRSNPPGSQKPFTHFAIADDAENQALVEEFRDQVDRIRPPLQEGNDPIGIEK